MRKSAGASRKTRAAELPGRRWSVRDRCRCLVPHHRQRCCSSEPFIAPKRHDKGSAAETAEPSVVANVSPVAKPQNSP